MTAFLVLVRMLHIGSALLMVSLLFFRQFILSANNAADLEPGANIPFSKLMAKWLMGIFLIQIVSGVAWFWIVANSLLDTLDFGTLKIVFEQTQFGHLWLWRTAWAVPLGLMLILTWRSERFSSGKGSIWRWIAFALSGFLLISLAWAGHAASGINHQVLHESADMVHLAIAAIWPGGLLPLVLFLITAAKTNQPSQMAYVVGTLHRFSRVSLVAVTLLFLTGFINAWFLIPSLSALYTSSYGQLLLGKIGLFLIMAGLGALNRFCFLPDLLADPKPSKIGRLRRIVLIENVLGLMVLLIVGAMGTTAPPQLPH